MANETYTLIEKIAVGATSVASVTFTSIPQTYTDLKIVACGRLSTSGLSFDSYDIKFNGSSSSFSGRYLYGGGSSVSSGTGTNYAGTVPAVLATANTFGNTEIYIPNYTGSTNKSFSVDAVAENNATAGEQVFYAGLWSNTAAITSIELIGFRGNIVQYSTFYLYGIAKEGVNPAPSSAPYATGGDSILFDGTYWIHTFTSSGTFTPKKALTCDYLVVAGGGGGGCREAGGGGAGGFRTATSFAVTANSAITVTVGAGGSGAASSSARGSTGSNSVFSTITSDGGGGGGSGFNTTSANGGSGGSGGGAGYAGSTAAVAGTGTAGQGNNGGEESTQGNAGGGGGASAAGAVGTSGTTGGAGGAGTASSYSGSSVTYAGGGGGAGQSTGGAGGAGGGGAGGTPVAGTANRGGGGGGSLSGATAGAAGGSGIVIVRYAA